MDLPKDAVQALNTPLRETSTEQAAELLRHNTVDTVLSLDGTVLNIKVKGADTARTGATIKETSAAIVTIQRDGKREAERLIGAFSLDIPNDTFDQLPPPIREQLKKSLEEKLTKPVIPSLNLMK
ncbi:MAG: hypothetical protein Q4P66_07905 [Actinomycetaceae bacterium]|nr:hypothetical protein [Actinomycetaceae bacterium]